MARPGGVTNTLITPEQIEQSKDQSHLEEFQRLYYDLVFWSISDYIVSRLYYLPKWAVIKLHQQMEKRRAKDTNERDRLSASMMAFMENLANSFTQSPTKARNPEEFLKYRIAEEQSEYYQQFIEELTPFGAESILEVRKSGDSPIAIKILDDIPDFMKAVEDKANQA